jgi:hypothetical protein
VLLQQQMQALRCWVLLNSAHCSQGCRCVQVQVY